jgi:hypothetical protein
MTKSNPQFCHPGRAAYELPKLLKNLGDIDSSVSLTTDQHNTVDAIVSHAWGAVETIASGLESIGALMGVVGHGESEVAGKHVAALGDLISHLAVELQHLHEVETDMASTLQSIGNPKVAGRRPN